MSDLAAPLQDNNRAKERLTPAHLSSAQKSHYSAIVRGETGPLLNLYGPAHSGKSFLAKTIASKNPEWDYHPWAPSGPINEKTLIVDNVPATRIASRRIREYRTFDDAKQVVAISRSQLPEISERLHLDQSMIEGQFDE